MNILFLHKDFPVEFKHIAQEFAKDINNNVLFLTNNPKGQIPKVNKIVYNIDASGLKNCHNYLIEHEEALLHAQSVASLTKELKDSNCKLDAIYTQAFGPGLFIKYMFPETPVIVQGEWYNRADGADILFDGRNLDIDFKTRLRCSNSCMLIDLYSCEACITPTHWQKQQFPKGFHEKIKVIPNGIDTEFFKPDANAKFTVKNKNIELSANNKVITYINKGLEPCNSFEQFIEAVSILLKKRLDIQVVIVGEDKVFYRPELFEENYKNRTLEKFEIDLNRVHFIDSLPEDEYLKLLQISSAHVYLTYPTALSDLLLEAMACGCCVVASNTQPVLEVIKNNENGLLVDFFKVNQLVEKIESAIGNKEMLKIRENARKTILDKYSLEKALPQKIKFIEDLINSSTGGLS